MKKTEFLDYWGSIPDNQPVLKHMTPIPYGSKGSKYGTCGIRIDGNPFFVEAVLSRLKDLLEGEGDDTRLACSYTEVDGEKLGKNFHNKSEDAVVAYIRLAERGEWAKGGIFKKLL